MLEEEDENVGSSKEGKRIKRVMFLFKKGFCQLS